ncbi:MAG: polysaccharide deacetylase family protein [Bacteroidota bacterium]
MAYLKKISTIGKLLYPSLLWKLPSKQKILYLTFDDGPSPEITPWVLEILKIFEAKATFFCVGENVSTYPSIFQQILIEGHHIGNHTYNHLKGWKTSEKVYLENVQLAEAAILKHSKPTTETNKLFRPPYGKILPGQIKSVQKLGYKIVMWDVISGDFDSKLSAENCYQNVIKNCSSGSIVVFHDSKKAANKLKEVLPKILKYYQERGFEFKAV